LRRWARVLEADSKERGLVDGGWSPWGGAGRLMVVHQEELLERPYETMKKVWEFAGLDAECSPDSTVVENQPAAFEVTVEEIVHIQENERRLRGEFSTIPGIAVSLAGVDASGRAPDQTSMVNVANGGRGGSGDRTALAGGMSALEYGKKRCRESVVDPELLSMIFNKSMEEFYAIEGSDLKWSLVDGTEDDVESQSSDLQRVENATPFEESSQPTLETFGGTEFLCVEGDSVDDVAKWI
jgi:hypothetical protein